MRLSVFFYGPQGYGATLPRTATERRRYLRDSAVVPLMGLVVVVGLVALHAGRWALPVVAGTIGTTLSRLVVSWRSRPRATAPTYD